MVKTRQLERIEITGAWGDATFDRQRLSMGREKWTEMGSE